jgi:hypothetical protein
MVSGIVNPVKTPADTSVWDDALPKINTSIKNKPVLNVIGYKLNLENRKLVIILSKKRNYIVGLT